MRSVGCHQESAWWPPATYDVKGSRATWVSWCIGAPTYVEVASGESSRSGRPHGPGYSPFVGEAACPAGSVPSVPPRDHSGHAEAPRDQVQGPPADVPP